MRVKNLQILKLDSWTQKRIPLFPLRHKKKWNIDLYALPDFKPENGKKPATNTNEREPQITNAKREAQREIQIEFNSICRINFPVFGSFVILFSGLLVQIPRAKVALVWYKHDTVMNLQSAQTFS